MLHTYFIADNITAFSTTRAGGVSCGTYASFNANHYCGDNPVHVAQNRRMLCEELGILEKHLIVPHQTHHTRIQNITQEFLELPDSERQQLLEDTDAVVTALPKVCVCVSTADCIPVFLYDRQNKVVAAIHAGWRGTCARIVEHTLDYLIEAFGTRPCDVKAVIGPGIGQDAFEVGDEVYRAFEKEGFSMDEIARLYPAREVPFKWHIDLWKCNQMQLLDKGVISQNIQIAGICTYSQSDKFFSARRLGIRSGRILNGIMMK